MNRCEGAGGSEEASTSVDVIDLRNYPDYVYEQILYRLGFDATNQAAKDPQKSAIAAKQIFADRICPMSWEMNTDDIREDAFNGNHIITIFSGEKILSMADNFGTIVKRIKVDYNFLDDDEDVNDMRTQINEKTIIKQAEHFTEFEAVAKNSFIEFLDEIQSGIRFPNVTKFMYEGPNLGNSYDLNVIFPNMESLTLYYNEIFMWYSHMDIDINCLAKITKLKELQLPS